MKNQKIIISLVVVILLIIGGIFYFRLNSVIQVPKSSPSDSELTLLITEAKSQNKLAEFGANFATNGSKDSVILLLRSIELSSGDDRDQLVRSLDALQSSEGSGELIDFLIKNASNVQGNTIVSVKIRDTLARIAKGEDVARIAQTIKDMDAKFTKSIDESGKYSFDDGIARSYLLGVLIRVQKEEAVPALVKLGLEDRNSGLYVSVIAALGSIGSPQAVTGLVEIIDKLKITNLNDPALQVLANIKNKDSIGVLENLSQNSTNILIRQMASSSLNLIASQKSN